ncbi:MAG: hypothetical protein HYX79_09975 [Chloroflexi bacterium]|nr:hypothetical protein [Chloroflexota bacterium]
MDAVDPGGPIYPPVVWTNPIPQTMPEKQDVDGIFNGLDTLVQSSGTDKASRESVKLGMKKAGVSDEQIGKVLSWLGVK